MGKAENTVEGYLCSIGEDNGFMCPKFTSPGRRGYPDRIIIGRGHVVFIETKAPKGALSEIQKKVIGRMRARGADVRCCYTREQVDAFFEEALAWEWADPQKTVAAAKG